MSDIWKPSVTVAAIIERQGKFLLVEEETSDGVRVRCEDGRNFEGEALIGADGLRSRIDLVQQARGEDEARVREGLVVR